MKRFLLATAAAALMLAAPASAEELVVSFDTITVEAPYNIKIVDMLNMGPDAIGQPMMSWAEFELTNPEHASKGINGTIREGEPVNIPS